MRELDTTSRRTVLRTLGVAVAGVAGATGAVASRSQREQYEPTTVAAFDPPRLPENVAVGSDGTHYLSMAPTGEIWAVTPGGGGSPGAVASLPVDRENPSALLLGITDSSDGDALFACVNSRHPETHGVWRVPLGAGGSPSRIAATDPETSTVNGITGDALDGDALLVTDHQRGVVWRVTPDGDRAVWLDSPLLIPNPYASSGVGVDGIDVGPDGDVWVDNLSFGSILQIPVRPDGSAGDPEVVAQSEALVGADGLTVDEAGTIYVAVNAKDRIVRIDRRGARTTIVSGGTLDFPSDVHFGRTEATRRTLYFTNFALVSARTEGQRANPSYAKIELGPPATTPAPPTGTATPAGNATEAGTATATEAGTGETPGTETATGTVMGGGTTTGS